MYIRWLISGTGASHGTKMAVVAQIQSEVLGGFVLWLVTASRSQAYNIYCFPNLGGSNSTVESLHQDHMHWQCAGYAAAAGTTIW
jgi:hypothetical protein